MPNPKSTISPRESAYIHLNANQVDKAVRDMYSKQGYSVLSEVRNGTGFERSARTADMLAVSTWPSRGLFAEGFEIKISRTDLAKELAHPEKAENIARYCRYWWLATPLGLVSELEILPQSWGLIEVDEKLKAKIIRRASDLSPIQMDTLFVCSVLRNFADSYVALRDVEPRIAEAKKTALEEAKRSEGRRLKDLQDGYEKFKELSGIDLLTEYGSVTWDLEHISEAIKAFTAMRNRPVKELLEAQSALESASAVLKNAIDLFRHAEAAK